MFFYAGGVVLWAFYELVLGVHPFPSLVAVGYLLFFPAWMPGRMTFPLWPGPKASPTWTCRVRTKLATGRTRSGCWHGFSSPRVRCISPGGRLGNRWRAGYGRRRASG